MTRVPTAPLVLGLVGLLPFLWGLVTTFVPALQVSAAQSIGPRFVGPYVSLAYGQVILAFMSGVLWGFATRADGSRASTAYLLSVLPALWAFLMVGNGPVSAAVNLTAGFVALLLLDTAFSRWGLTPPWWMSLRIGLTAVVVLCLMPLWLL